MGAVLILAGTFAAPPAEGKTAELKRVLLITIDGLRADAVTPVLTPNLIALQSEGVFSNEGRCVLPPRTVPNHISMLTGVAPRKHGFKENLYAEDIFLEDSVLTRLRAAGYSTGLYLNKWKLRLLGSPADVDRLLLTETGLSRDNVKQFFSDLARSETRWDFTLVHLVEPDWIGHQYGWMSPSYFTAVHVADFHVGQIFETLERLGLKDETLVIVISDHGGKKRRHKHNIPECTLIPFFAVGPGLPTGRILDEAVTVLDVAPTILEAFKLPVPETMTGRSILSLSRNDVTSKRR